ncbi:putative pentatricopeptide repeat-containing protein, mitochondrial [Heracleum sosnowskyi]|uniref:Pentatricopeptide repeat-containing protein, mitochondrial n=1 Tax=Heracleum sosnowskyi TaxID=360622 RepID=A0AAD8JDJ0_9APIA|nr:putative pentatricopeptide repeat-containing protein, mitochondrial [Heracleum sosnowskyi]
MAFMLFKYMEKKGCKPNVVTYSTIIDSLAKDSFVDDALGLLAEMGEKGIHPNVITYSSLIQGLCNLNRWQDIMQLLKDMDNRKISPNVHTYNILVDAHGRDGKIMLENGKFEAYFKYVLDGISGN